MKSSAIVIFCTFSHHLMKTEKKRVETFCIFLRISFELLLTSLHQQFLYTGIFPHVLHLNIKFKVKLNYMVFNGDRPWQSLWHAGLLGFTLYRSLLSHFPYFLWPVYVDILLVSGASPPSRTAGVGFPYIYVSNDAFWPWACPHAMHKRNRPCLFYSAQCVEFN